MHRNPEISMANADPHSPNPHSPALAEQIKPEVAKSIAKAPLACNWEVFPLDYIITVCAYATVLPILWCFVYLLYTVSPYD